MAQSNADENINLNKPTQDNDKETSSDSVMDDNEVAALLASLKHKIPSMQKMPSIQKTPSMQKIPSIPSMQKSVSNTKGEEHKTQKTQHQNEKTNDKSSNNNNETKKPHHIQTVHKTEQKTNGSPTSRKRTYSEMTQSQSVSITNDNNTNISNTTGHSPKPPPKPAPPQKLSDPRTKRPKTIIKRLKPLRPDIKEQKPEKSEKPHTEIPSNKLPTTTATEPFTNTDWTTTKFIYIRLTYFNKRKCRKFPLSIAKYATFSNFIQYYFPSLHDCKWHAEADENWIESLDDFNAIRDAHISSQSTANLFLELMIVNESLSMKNIYAPKAVYIHNPYKCPYPPTNLHNTAPKHAQMAPHNNPQTPPTQIHAAPPAVHTPAPVPAYNPYLNQYPSHPMYPAVASMQNMIQHPMQNMQPQPSMLSRPASQPQTQISQIQADVVENGGGGYHHVTYPHYLSASKSNHAPKAKDRDRERSGGMNQSRRSSAVLSGAVCPDPTTYLPFAHAGQSTPQMRTLHKIVWVLQHQSKPLPVDAIRSCLPGKKKAQINEIDYLLSTYESYNYTKSTMVSSRKVWTLCPSAFPTEFWNMQWQRTVQRTN